ncbi:MAG: tRNA uridine-5-carboxymethylaminomethyl(34) synthesis GTPase MnmE [Legionella sp.]|nr:MAG: tRNA uridine-5-carboxymethylaminomethyl(34) synthesis GTPase MnmE [Legionella sp.]PJD97130.1 MAG: tRNA uridine-5-carboxymethylaminomethyl(34) synthesis GTPase MnmE [Legionella sp.]
MTDTIVAIATPPGRGGVGILRLSGPDAYSIALKFNAAQPLTARHAQFTSFFNRDQEVLDQGLLLYFKAPHSFTGEDVVEFHAHGSPVVLDMLLKEMVHWGARLARPGEFSERAFLNDKIDLTQAEAIADLIQASSDTSARMALKTLQGDFSKKVNQLNQQIIYLRMYVEAAIDFPEEEIDFLNDGKVMSLLQAILNELNTIYSQAHQGVILREGLSLVIAGRPNAGKSTLINSLAGRDVAIVTDVAGTTRDVMREHILLDDIPLHVIDTAGLRDSDDIVEQEGIKRARKELENADVVLLLIDAQYPEQQAELRQEVQAIVPPSIPLLTVLNKIDLFPQGTLLPKDILGLSAKTGLGLADLKQQIKDLIGYQPIEGQFLARRRHLEALDMAKQILLEGQTQLIQHQAGELLAEDLRLAHQVLGEITGEFSADDLLGSIFSSFCIGK